MTPAPDLPAAAGKRVFRRSEEVIARTVLDEILLVPVRGHLALLDRIFGLSGVAGFVWESIDGVRSLEEIRGDIAARFDAPDAVIDADLAEFAEALLQAGLVVESA